MRAITSFVVVALALGLAGCTSKTPASQPQGGIDGETRPTAGPIKSNGSSIPENLTDADYAEALRLTSNCMAKSNVELVNRGLNPVNGHEAILTYRSASVPGDKVFEIARVCRATHLDAVEAGFREQHPALMAPELMKAISKCLTDKGISLTGQEKNSQDLTDVVPKNRRLDLLDCVHDNGRKMYPALPITFP
ncbi:hypothetical protein OHQ88_23200 [Micromonospora zamorensis]|uniref:Lipoprotein n=1 Tax=Micromonospora zamorensis TaxID=709883 RepID=A0ABZ1PBK8_9ACTN